MSSSPMYAQVAVSREAEQRLAEAARRREEERQRKAEEARRKRLEVSREATRNRSREVRQRVVELQRQSTGTSAALAVRTGAADMERQLVQLTQRINHAPDQQTLAAAKRDLGRVTQKLDELEVRLAEAVNHAREEALASIAVAVQRLDRAVALRFDSDGAALVAARLSRLLDQLQQGDSVSFDGELPEAREAVRRHLSTVSVNQEAWEAGRDAAAEAVGRIGQQWEVLAADAAAMGLPDNWGAPIWSGLEAARSAITGGHHSEALQIAAVLDPVVTAAGLELDRRLEEVERRTLVVAAAQGASNELGMEVSEVSTRSDGAVVIRLQRMDGNEVVGLLAGNGHGSDQIMWRSENDIAEAELLGGEVDRPCDIARTLEELHERMHQHGAEVGPLACRNRIDGDPSTGAQVSASSRPSAAARRSA